MSAPADCSRLPNDWAAFVDLGAVARVSESVRRIRDAGTQVFPPKTDTFRALWATPVDAVKVVILGQDPYHGEGQAHGLAFSVRTGVATPPSLRNVFKELASDLGRPPSVGTDLTPWAEQGVLLLNSTLTVNAGDAASHSKLGWEPITDALIRGLATNRTGLVFLLWGAPAQKKAAFVDPVRHHVVAAPHPSPLSAHKGFFGCRHFSRANAFLVANGRTPIAW